MSREISFHKKSGNNGKRWVLLEHIPTILTPKILLLLFVYSVAFTLLIVGLKLFHLEKVSAKNSYSYTNLSKDSSLSSDAYMDFAHNNQQIQKNIAKNIVRFHVIANSDTKLDQDLKLKVRNEVVNSLQNSLRNADSVKQAKEIITARESQIQSMAQRVLAQYNCHDSVSVALTKRYFPIKQYGDLSFPAGTYDALCIEIGKAKGHNWWCVLFPSLCFVDETTATVPKDSKNKLKENLSEEEYQSLQEKEDVAKEKPEIHFGISDWFQ